MTLFVVYNGEHDSTLAMPIKISQSFRINVNSDHWNNYKEHYTENARRNKGESSYVFYQIQSKGRDAVLTFLYV